MSKLHTIEVYDSSDSHYKYYDTDDFEIDGHTLEEHDKRIRAEAFEEVYNLIDEGVCDMCECQNFDGDCFKTCQEEITIVKNWVKKKAEIK